MAEKFVLNELSSLFTLNNLFLPEGQKIKANSFDVFIMANLYALFKVSIFQNE